MRMWTFGYQVWIMNIVLSETVLRDSSLKGQNKSKFKATSSVRDIKNWLTV